MNSDRRSAAEMRRTFSPSHRLQGRRRQCPPLLLLALGATALTAVPIAARANNWDFKSGDWEADLGVSYGAGGFVTPNAQFGNGSYDIRAQRDYLEGLRPSIGDSVGSPAWGEGYVKPEVRLSYHIDPNNTLGANVSAVYAQTIGDGDANLFSYTRGFPGSVELEEAFVSYTGPTLFGLPGDNTVVKLGRQNFAIDDGFLIQLGTFNAGMRAAYYLAPRTSWDWSGTVSFNYNPVRGDVFVLRNNVDNDLTYGRSFGNSSFAVDNPQTNLVGFDATWFQNASTKGADGAQNYGDRQKYVTFTYFHVFDANEDPSLYPSSNFALSSTRRDGENVFSAAVGGNLIPIPVLGLKENAALYANYVYETNSGEEYGMSNKVSASAYYVEPDYTFTTLPWSPRVYYRYSHFSGQNNNDPNAAKTSYDPFFYDSGIRASFGTYFLGEIVGQYIQSNTNMNVNQVGLTLNTPYHILNKEDGLKFDAIYYRFNYDHPEEVGATNRNLATELDLITEYQLDPATAIDGAFGVANAGTGLEQADKTTLTSLGQGTDFGHQMYVAELFFSRSF